MCFLHELYLKLAQYFDYTNDKMFLLYFKKSQVTNNIDIMWTKDKWQP